HEQCRADALAADVRHDQAHASRSGQLEGVVEVTADAAGRLEPGGDVPAVGEGQRLGEEAGLDLAGDVELALQAAGVDLLPVVEPLAGEAGLDAGPQDLGVE